MAWRDRMPHVRLGHALGRGQLKQHQVEARFERRQILGPVESDSSTSATNTRNNTPASSQTTAASSSVVESSPVDTETTASSTRARTTEVESSVTEESSTSATTSSTLLSSSSSVLVSSATRAQSTSVVTNIVTVPGSSSTVLPSISSSAAPSSGGDGPSTGAVVGIVAGGLVGVVVIAGLLGYFFKAKFGKDDDDIDDDVFNKNDFRRQSVMILDNDNDDRMSMRSGSAAGTLNRHNAGFAGYGAAAGHGLNRANTAGQPSLMDRHYMNTNPGFSPMGQNFPVQPMPSFQPGQVISPNFYGHPGGAPQQYQEDAFAMQPQHYSNDSANLDRNNTIASHYATVEGTRAPTSHSQYAELDRQPSSGSQYGYAQDAATYPPNRADYAYDQPMENMHQDNYQQYQHGPVRSGTPTDPNQQQYFTDRQARDSAGSQRQARQIDRAQRGLSIRNTEDAYSGI